MMMNKPYKNFVTELSPTISADRIITSPLKTLAYGTDASFYRLIPKVVIFAHGEAEIIEILKQANKYGIATTFRAAGTSLSGQAITDSVLVVATHGWKQYTLLDNNQKIRLEPGIVGAKANNFLSPHGLKIGPDPASVATAMIGGIVANNASGMCCGTSQNSYKTIEDIRIILHDGTILDTADEQSVQDFKLSKKEIVKEIELLRDVIINNKPLHDKIQQKYKIKNTTGYSINAFIDYHDPIDIIKHLIVGSEGTLAFISNVTFKTVIDEKHKACSLVIFSNIKDACNATILLKSAPVAAVELLDRESIRSVENDPAAPEYFKTLPESACALLIECRDNDLSELKIKETDIRKQIDTIKAFADYEFTSEPAQYNFNWKARKGLLPTVGGLRKTGTTVIIEDVAFPLPVLADACLALKELFRDAGYTDAVLFGHALDGNLHLVFSQDFSNQTEIDRYDKLMSNLSTLVLDRFSGSLKAEHGTGRNMAPFVEKEWGTAAYQIMKRIKKILDPHNIINPDVLINPDPKAHLKNLKPLPATNEIIDKCMECGFCEPNCVSEGLTLSPRQRIVIAREISRLRATNENPTRLSSIKKEAKYQLNETCATDGLCAIACPLNIDTGKYVKQLRASQNNAIHNTLARFVASNIGLTTALLRLLLRSINLLGINNNLKPNNSQAETSMNKQMPHGRNIISILPRASEKIKLDTETK